MDLARIPVDIEKVSYAKAWKEDACAIKRQGGYDWMCQQVADTEPKRILEIGCGTGESTLSLHQNFHPRLISVEENPCCLEKTANLLRKRQLDFDQIMRLSYVEASNGQHLIGTSDQPIRACASISLIQADVLLPDRELHNFLKTQAPFDLVTVWLMGSSMMRLNCANLNAMRRSDSREYVLHVQNKIYSLSGELLRPGGILQIVDRGEALDDDFLYDACIKSHEDQAKGTSMMVVSASWKNYEVKKGTKIALVDSIVLNRKKNPLSWVSIKSKKLDADKHESII